MMKWSYYLIIYMFLFVLLPGLNTGCEMYLTENDTESGDIELNDNKARGPVDVISDLRIGDRVMDKSWEWDHKLGMNYTDEVFGEPTPPGETKPVTWIVVAKDHYGPGSGVTLLAEELIGMFAFDDSQDDYLWGSNHWGASGAANADKGIRPWLNSTGIHDDEGFYNNFSENFKDVLLRTTVPNNVWDTGSNYTTQDKVFIPSKTEISGEGDGTHETGTVFPYFEDAENSSRTAKLGDIDSFYWTRSPDSCHTGIVRIVLCNGGFDGESANSGKRAVRPVLNIKPEIKVSEAANENGVYEIIW